MTQCPKCGHQFERGDPERTMAERAADLTLMHYVFNNPEAQSKPMTAKEQEHALAVLEEACAQFEQEFGISLWKQGKGA